MSYKTIVVHLEPGPRCAARVALAARLAGRYGSRLVGIAPTGLPDVIVAMNSAVPDAIECVALSAADLRENAAAAARAFEEQCRRDGVASFQAEVVVDEAVDAMVGRGRCSDLIVVGQTDVGAPVEGVAFDFPQQVLLNAGPPVLVVPYTGRFASLGERVLVGWKDTREAARALRDALPLLRDARRVSLVEVGAVGPDAARDDSLGAASAWLASHAVAFDAHREIELAGVGDQLLSRASDLGVDLIVCGGYGHSRLREWVLGGVTKHLLQHMTVPTLLSH
jgi:nucleotide-binding universal stress UspA family protein